jgi:ABC-type transport system substrate-binding protein
LGGYPARTAGPEKVGEEWDTKSPWHDRRVRLAANYAIDRNAINRAETLGFSKITGSVIPSSFATRIEAFVAAGGAYVYGSDPDIDGLFRAEASEMDRKQREASLQKIQQIMYDQAMFAPIWELGFLNGVGPRVGESGLGVIRGHAYSAPYEDLTLKAN